MIVIAERRSAWNRLDQDGSLRLEWVPIWPRLSVALHVRHRVGDQVVSGYSNPGSGYEYWTIDGLHYPVRDGQINSKNGREGWAVSHQGFVEINVVARCYG